jgi:hypothetical protein
VRITDAKITDDNWLSSAGISAVAVEDKFDIGLQVGSFASVDAIVMMVWNELQLWCVAQENLPSELIDVEYPLTSATKFIRNGHLYIQYNGAVFGMMGERVFPIELGN